MDHDSSRVLQEVKDNSAIIGILREIFETEAVAETERSTAYSLNAATHNATVCAARAAAFRSVVSTIMEYGVNDNG